VQWQAFIKRIGVQTDLTSPKPASELREFLLPRCFKRRRRIRDPPPVGARRPVAASWRDGELQSR